MIWSGIVRHVTLGQRTFGSLTEPVKKFSELPSDMKAAYNFIFLAPDYYLKTKDADKETINKLSYDLYGSYAYRNGDAFKIELKNFKNDELIKTWDLPVEYLSKHHEVGTNDRLYPSKLMENRGVIVSCDERPGLIRLDSASNVVWHNKDFIFHHAVNFDAKGNAWICGAKHKNGSVAPSTVSVDGKKINYRDDLIVNVDAKTGKTLYSKSLTELFKENNLSELINRASVVEDPFHLNDVEPVVLQDSTYFNTGDVFMSFRHLSAIIQYRPSTEKVIKVIEGPFTYQHDVDILSPNTIALFNNNGLVKDNSNYENYDTYPKTNVQREIINSNILVYNFEEDTYNALYEKAFIDNKIYTGAEGLYDLLPNGDLFVEEQNSGILWVLNENGVVLKTTLKSDIEGYHYLPNWTSIYTNINF